MFAVALAWRKLEKIGHVAKADIVKRAGLYAFGNDAFGEFLVEAVKKAT